MVVPRPARVVGAEKTITIGEFFGDGAKAVRAGLRQAVVAAERFGYRLLEAGGALHVAGQLEAYEAYEGAKYVGDTRCFFYRNGVQVSYRCDMCLRRQVRRVSLVAEVRRDGTVVYRNRHARIDEELGDTPFPADKCEKMLFSSELRGDARDEVVEELAHVFLPWQEEVKIYWRTCKGAAADLCKAGIAAVDAGDFAKAAEQFDKAIAALPEDAGPEQKAAVRYNRGRARELAGIFPGAVKDLAEAFKLQPEDAEYKEALPRGKKSQRYHAAAKKQGLVGDKPKPDAAVTPLPPPPADAVPTAGEPTPTGR